MAVVSPVVAGGAPEPIVVCGAAVSTVQVWVAGEASTLPAASVARTRNSCAPCAQVRVRLRRRCSAMNGPPSSEQEKRRALLVGREG